MHLTRITDRFTVWGVDVPVAMVLLIHGRISLSPKGVGPPGRLTKMGLFICPPRPGTAEAGTKPLSTTHH